MIPNHSVIVSVTEPKGKNRKKVWFRKGRNSFNKNDIISGAYLSDKGVITKNDGQNYSNYISVVSNTMYTIHAENSLGVAPSVCFYDENKNFISGIAYNNVKIMSFKTTTTCKFVRVSVPNANLETLQLEAGTIATPYEAYVENKMFVKNSNDVYEEFINKKELEKEIFVNKTPFTANEGYTIDLQYMNKQGKHYWGTVVFHKNSGMFGSSEIALKCNVELAQIFSYGCFLGTNTYNALAVGYLHLRANQELYVGDNNNTSKYNYARCFVDFIEK